MKKLVRRSHLAPNFKAFWSWRYSNGIHQSFDSLVKIDSEESSENKNNILYGFKKVSKALHQSCLEW